MRVELLERKTGGRIDELVEILKESESPVKYWFRYNEVNSLLNK